MKKGKLCVRRVSRRSRGFRFSFTMMLIGTVLCVHADAALAADGWHRIFTSPISSHSDCPALVEFKGKIYVAMGGTDSSDGYDAKDGYKLYRLGHYGDIYSYEDVTPPWRTATSSSSVPRAMAVFNDQIYVGTDNREIFRSAYGNNWTKCSLPSLNSDRIRSMAEFTGTDGKKYLYVAIDGAVYRTQDGNTWTPVVGPLPALHTYSFGKSGRMTVIDSLEVFNGYLYTGVGGDDANGIWIYRTKNGRNWYPFAAPGGNPSGHAHALKAFNGHLYIGQYGGSGLWRTDGKWDGKSDPWKYISTGAESICRLAERAGKLYIGVWPEALAYSSGMNEPLMHFSADGEQWSAVPNSPRVDKKTWGTRALLSSGGNLYVGIEKRGAPAEVYLYGEPPKGLGNILVRHATLPYPDRILYMDGHQLKSTGEINSHMAQHASFSHTDRDWKMVGTGDFNNDGETDILWRNATLGQNYVYFMNGRKRWYSSFIDNVSDPNWEVCGVADFNRDGCADILWQYTTTGTVSLWLMKGNKRLSHVYVPPAPGWRIVGTGDFNGDFKTDILWRHPWGFNVVWYMDRTAHSLGSGMLPTVADSNWDIVGTGDFNSDGKTDILWGHTSGLCVSWDMDGIEIKSTAWIGYEPDTNWYVVGTGDFD